MKSIRSYTALATMYAAATCSALAQEVMPHAHPEPAVNTKGVVEERVGTKDIGGRGFIFNNIPYLGNYAQVSLNDTQSGKTIVYGYIDNKMSLKEPGKDLGTFVAIGKAFQLPFAQTTVEAGHLSLPNGQIAPEIYTSTTFKTSNKLVNSLNPTIEAVKSFGDYPGHYLAATISHSFPLGNGTLTTGARLGFNDHYAMNNAQFSHSTYEATWCTPLWQKISGTISLRVQRSINGHAANDASLTAKVAYKY